MCSALPPPTPPTPPPSPPSARAVKKETAPKPAKPAPAPAAPAAAPAADSEDTRALDKPQRSAPKGGNAPSTRGGRGGYSGRGREFDRISGTGRGKEVSKGGAGGHNWGSAEEEARKAEQGTSEEAAPAAEGEAAAEGAEAKPAAEGEAAAPAAPAEPEVVEPPTKTLDEVLAERAALRTGAMFATVKEDTSKLMEQFAKGACVRVRAWAVGRVLVCDLVCGWVKVLR